MPDTELLDDLEHKDPDEGSDDDLGEFLPGELCAVDATNDRIDLDDLTDEQKGCFKILSREVSKRDTTSYRIEVRDAWKQRYFYRGNQYLFEGKNGAWILPRMVLMAGQSFDDHNDETNIYLAFGDTIAAALTAGTPYVRFEAADPSLPADITTAEKSEDAKKLFERANDIQGVMAEMARYLWTDARCAFYTHHVVDAQRWGRTNDDVDEEISFLEGEAGDQQGNPTQTGEPRSQQVVEPFGVLETKFPIQVKTIEECDFVQLSREFDVTRLQTKYWQFADQIEASAMPTAQSDYVRLARVSINMGMRPSNMTNDAQTYSATEVLTWVRPTFYKCAGISDELRDWLLEVAPNGCMVAMVGDIVVEARSESMDDHWSLVHARPGDGMHRPSLGYPLTPLQEKLNDAMNLVHESFMHLIPRIWVDPSIDLDALEKTERKPGQYLKSPKSKDGKTIADNFFPEPQIQLAEGLLVYIEKLFGEFAQFLCGAFPALFGGDTKANDTASGISQQRDQALGRMGLTWRNIKSAYARMMRQAVQGIGQYQVGKLSGELDGQNGQKNFLEIDPDDLKGNVKTFPDPDENIPESWAAQRAVWNTLLAMAEKNPVIAKIVTLPKNILVMKDKIGTPELTIPDAAAEEQQLIEIQELINSEPEPNPVYQQAQAVLAHVGQVMPEALPLAQQKVANISPFISSVPIDKVLNDHAVHMQAIKTYSCERDGMKARVEKPRGWINLQLHYQEHAAALAAAQQNTPPKPPSESINYKDLETVDAKIAMLKQAGINVDPTALKAEMDKADQEAAAAAAAKNSPGNSGAGGSSGQSGNSGGGNG